MSYDPTWRLTPIVSDESNLERIGRAGLRALECRDGGMPERRIVSMLNAWWPRLAPAPNGVWTVLVTRMLCDAASTMRRTYVNRSYDSAEHAAFGRRYIRWMFDYQYTRMPETWSSIQSILMHEDIEQQFLSSSRLNVERLTGYSVPASCMPRLF